MHRILAVRKRAGASPLAVLLAGHVSLHRQRPHTLAQQLASHSLCFSKVQVNNSNCSAGLSQRMCPGAADALASTCKQCAACFDPISHMQQVLVWAATPSIDLLHSATTRQCSLRLLGLQLVASANRRPLTCYQCCLACQLEALQQAVAPEATQHRISGRCCCWCQVCTGSRPAV